MQSMRSRGRSRNPNLLTLRRSPCTIIHLVFSRYLVQSRFIRRSSKPHALFLRRGLATEDVKPLPESNIVRMSEYPAHV